MTPVDELFYEDGAEAGPARVYSRGQTCRSASDNDQITIPRCHKAGLEDLFQGSLDDGLGNRSGDLLHDLARP